MPCFIKLTLVSKLHGEPDETIYKNMSAISTIEGPPQGGSVLWSNGKSTWVKESPAQIVALIQEASK